MEEIILNNIDEAVEVHVVIPPVVDHPRDVIVLDDHFVSGINDMASICGKDTVVLEFMGGLRERSRKFIEQVSESGQGYLVPALDESGLRRNPVVLHVKETDKFCASSTFSHGKDQAHGVGERKLAERLAHEIMAGIRGEKPVSFSVQVLMIKVCLLKLNEMDAWKQISCQFKGRLVWQKPDKAAAHFLLPVK